MLFGGFCSFLFITVQENSKPVAETANQRAAEQQDSEPAEATPTKAPAEEAPSGVCAGNICMCLKRNRLNGSRCCRKH